VKGAIAHLRYIDRDGKLEVDTDEGSKLKGEEVAHALVWEWDLEASRADARSPYCGKSPWLVSAADLAELIDSRREKAGLPR
jgi:hypothetical protein